MITINLDLEKELKYGVSDPDKILSVNFVISFLNNVVYRFPGNINIESNEVVIKIKPLKDMIKNEISANCYVEVILKDGGYYKVEKNTIEFIKTAPITLSAIPSAEVSFESVLKSDKTEIPLDMTNVVTKKVSYTKKEKRKIKNDNR